MTAKTLVLPIAVSISLLLAGCASKPTHTPEQLAHGVKFEGLQADIPLDPGFSRPHQVAHVFGIPVKDLDPETKNIATIAERRGLNSFISGAVDNGLAGGLVAVAISSLDSSAKIFRTEVDEWNAIVDPSGYATIYEAESEVLKNVTERTTKGLRKQGYKVLSMGSETEGGNGKPVFVESSLTLINEARGCPKPASDDEGCRLKLSTPAFTHSSREAPPAWLSDLKEAFIIRGMVMMPAGETADGSAFALSREDREAIGREAGDGCYFYGAYDSSHAGFVGEDGKVEYCHLVPEKLARHREYMKKSVGERVVDTVSEKYQKNWEKCGVWGVLFPRDVEELK